MGFVPSEPSIYLFFSVGQMEFIGGLGVQGLAKCLRNWRIANCSFVVGCLSFKRHVFVCFSPNWANRLRQNMTFSPAPDASPRCFVGLIL